MGDDDGKELVVGLVETVEIDEIVVGGGKVVVAGAPWRWTFFANPTLNEGPFAVLAAANCL